MIKNSNVSYGSVAKWLHWLTAICVLVAYFVVYYSHWTTEPRTPDRRALTAIHTMFGFSVLIFAVPRLIWRLINERPKPETVPRWQRISARLNHWALYFAILAMPLTGWMSFGAQSINLFWLVEVPTFRHTALFAWLVEGKMGMTFDVFEVPFDFLHKQVLGPWVVWLLVALHVSAAIYHHRVLKDNTLRRMLPGGK
jgi:cytochrome b561